MNKIELCCCCFSQSIYFESPYKKRKIIHQCLRCHKDNCFTRARAIWIERIYFI